MANFPTSTDELTNPLSSDELNSPSHSAQHGTANDILEALEAKVGIDSSAVETSHDYKIGVLESGAALLAGRSGGQTIYGGTAANEDLTLEGTSHATKTTSYLNLQPNGGNVGIGGCMTPAFPLCFGTSLGQKISLYSNVATGLGLQVNLMELIGYSTDLDWTFGTGVSGSLARVVTIEGTGNVGIGTESPLELLSLGTAGTKAGVLSLAGATSGKAIIDVSAAAGTPTLTLPTTTGTLALTSDITGTNSGSNTGDQDLSGKANVDQTMYIGTTGVNINRGSATLNLAGIGTLGCGAITTSGKLFINWTPSATEECTKYIKFQASDGTKNPQMFIKQTVDIDDNVHKFIFDSLYSSTIGYADFEFLHGDVSFSNGNLTTNGTLACGAITSTGDIKANTSNYVLEGSTTRAVLRTVYLQIEPGATPGTNLNITDLTDATHGYNGPTITDAVNLAKNGTEGSFELPLTGKDITLNLTEDIVGIVALTIVNPVWNSAEVEPYYIYPYSQSNALHLAIRKAGSATTLDWTTILDASDDIRIYVSFITST